MKTTSYEISKKLKEAGFEAETDDFWVKWNEGEATLINRYEPTPSLIEKISAYDLETILESVPMGIDKNEKRYDLVIEQRVFFYYSDDDGNELEEFSIMQKQDESLADTAARLWLVLKQENLI